MGERRWTTRAGVVAATLTVVAGVLAVACSAGDEADEKAELAAHRCEPVSSSASGLSGVFPKLGPLTSASWCAQALGTPDTARLTVPGPHDWVYYGIVRLVVNAAAEAWGPWQPSSGPRIPEMPSALRSLVPAHGQWSYNGTGTYWDQASQTLVLSGLSAETTQQ